MHNKLSAYDKCVRGVVFVAHSSSKTFSFRDMSLK